MPSDTEDVIQFKWNRMRDWEKETKKNAKQTRSKICLKNNYDDNRDEINDGKSNNNNSNNADDDDCTITHRGKQFWLP